MTLDEARLIIHCGWTTPEERVVCYEAHDIVQRHARLAMLKAIRARGLAIDKEIADLEAQIRPAELTPDQADRLTQAAQTTFGGPR